ncbi:peptidoglycan-binding protein [uncultured Brevundimonas sp.]|uniref:peptidoglycan-binding protein n=1 Tax=uncultured Brevundimonas sp. TaxID=213418 RepID=UPI0030EE97D0|tara:strand:- start:7529 stop:7735 length:207 start_codon:yes stop_codon:yes gene_type:complete
MTDSTIPEARRLLQSPTPVHSPWATLVASALAATAAVLMAGVMVLGPGVRFNDTGIPVDPATVPVQPG